MMRSTWPLSFRKSTVVASIRVRGGQPFLRGFYGPLRYEPCVQFINVSQRAHHICWQFSAMSHAIHKIVRKKRCQSYFISRRSPHHGISKDSDLCASAHRCLYYAYARLIARVTFNLFPNTIQCHIIQRSPTVFIAFVSHTDGQGSVSYLDLRNGGILPVRISSKLEGSG